MRWSESQWHMHSQLKLALQDIIHCMLTSNQSTIQHMWVGHISIEVVKGASGWGIRAGSRPVVGLHRIPLSKAHHKAVAHPI